MSSGSRTGALALLALWLAACATAEPSASRADAWDVAQRVIGMLPPRGQAKWASLSAAQQAEVVALAEPFLLRWNADRDRRHLAVILSAFTAGWNARAPEPAVTCTLLETVQCY